jgi:hypothetical protein
MAYMGQADVAEVLGRAETLVATVDEAAVKVKELVDQIRRATHEYFKFCIAVRRVPGPNTGRLPSTYIDVSRTTLPTGCAPASKPAKFAKMQIPRVSPHITSPTYQE